MSAKVRRIATLALAASGLVLPGLASAQSAYTSDFAGQRQGRSSEDPDPNVPVQSRPRPDYDPIGLRAGSFLIYPAITLGGLYDSNVFATKNDTKSDFAVTVTPQVTAQSNFSRHQIVLQAGGDLAYYADNSELNHQDAYLQGSGRLDITRDDKLNGDFAVSRLHEDPSSPDSEASSANDVTEYYRDSLGLTYRHDFARFYTQVGGSVIRYDFQDHDDLDTDQRDRNQYIVRARGGYEISPRLNAVLLTSYDVRRYDTTEQVDRNSEGFTVQGGAEIDFTGILFGELTAGYVYRKYNDSSLDSTSGPGFGGKLTWNITPLTTIIFNLQGSIEETTVTFEGDEASADFQKLGSVDVTHELLRNVLLNANAAYIRDDFEGTSRTDNTVAVGAGVSYLLNRHLSLDTTYQFSTRDSDANAEEYTRSIVRVGLTAKL